MVLSRRERYLGIGTAVVIGLLVLDQMMLRPLFARKTHLESEIALKHQQIQREGRLMRTARSADQTMKELAGTTLRRDASEAEMQVLHSVREWAQDAGLTLSSLKPERTEREKDFYKITFRATGGGTMAQASRFLWRIQSSSVPVRVTDVQIASRREGADDLSVQMGIATIYPVPEAERNVRGPFAREAQP